MKKRDRERDDDDMERERGEKMIHEKEKREIWGFGERKKGHTIAFERERGRDFPTHSLSYHVQMNVAWKRRWFVLTDGTLFYYHHLSSLNAEDTPGDLKGTITIGSETEVRR